MNPPLQTPPANSYPGGATEGKLGSAFPLEWQMDHYEREEMLLIPQRSTDLLQNCDLPPPLKVFPATPKKFGDSAAAPTLQSPPHGLIGLTKTGPEGGDEDRGGDTQDHLLKALRLSQTRAREAEKKAAALGEKNKQMASLLMEESLALYAHRQWLKLLEMENTWLRRRESSVRAGGADVGTAPAQGGCVVLAVCLCIAGLGFVIGCRFML